jgi:hypothetical protein
VTEVEVPPGAGLARYALSNYLIFGPGTWRERENREAVSTVQEENDLSLLYHDGNLRLLSFDMKEWSLGRKTQDLSIQRRWHPAFCLKMGALRLYIWSMVLEEGGAISWASPFFHTPSGSVLPVLIGYKSRECGPVRWGTS